MLPLSSPCLQVERDRQRDADAHHHPLRGDRVHGRARDRPRDQGEEAGCRYGQHGEDGHGDRRIGERSAVGDDGHDPPGGEDREIDRDHAQVEHVAPDGAALGPALPEDRLALRRDRREARQRLDREIVVVVAHSRGSERWGVA
jgi:hypothetical protein